MSDEELFDQDSLEWLQSREFPYKPKSGPFMAGMAVDVADAKEYGKLLAAAILKRRERESGKGVRE